MTETATPICDLIESLLSEGLSPGTVIATARKIEAAMIGTTRSSEEPISQRERWRLKKAAQRAGKPASVPGTSGDIDPEGICTNNKVVLSKSKKKKPDVPLSEGQVGTSLIATDDWPEGYFDIFWKAFPPYRREAKAKVAAKLARIRADKISWGTLFDGVRKFAATNPGNYAPAPLVWLNGGRWDREYGTQQGGENGKAQGAGGAKVGFAGIAARIRQNESNRDLPFDESSGGPE